MSDNNTHTEYNSDRPFKSIKEWSEDDRPREKLLLKGPEALSNSELIAILLATGTKNLSAIDCARMLIDKFETLESLAKRRLGDLKSVKGIGEAKAITLMAAFELARRVKPKKFDGSRVIRSPEDIAAIYIPRLKDEVQESFRILHMDSANALIRERVITKGLLNMSLVHPREVFRDAISESAKSIMLLHNHPSGNPSPSSMDIKITKQLQKAGELLEIPVLDHIIIAGDSFTSLQSLGHL